MDILADAVGTLLEPPQTPTTCSVETSTHKTYHVAGTLLASRPYNSRTMLPSQQSPQQRRSLGGSIPEASWYPFPAIEH